MAHNNKKAKHKRRTRSHLKMTGKCQVHLNWQIGPIRLEFRPACYFGSVNCAILIPAISRVSFGILSVVAIRL